MQVMMCDVFQHMFNIITIFSRSLGSPGGNLASIILCRTSILPGKKDGIVVIVLQK